MIKYSIDTMEREKTYFVIAVLSLIITPYVIDLINKITPVNVIAPSAMMIFVFLLFLYNNYVWRLASKARLSCIPDLNGEYSGKIERNDGRKYEVSVIISQTWSKIDFILESDETIGKTELAGLLIENNNLKRLKTIYSVSPKANINNENLYGEGVNEFRIRKEDGIFQLEGHSYSSKLRGGKILLRRIKIS